MERLPQSVQDLADEFGLSRVTVSYILNDRWREKRIAEKTARKVLEYVRKTGFQPNTFGQALRGESLKEIAILLPVNPLAHHRNALFAMLGKLEDRHRSYLVLPYAPESLPNTLYFLKNCRIPQVMIFATAIDPVSLAEWQQLLRNLNDVRVLFYDFPFHSISPDAFAFLRNAAFIGIDRRAATRQIFEYMARAGYRQWVVDEFYRSMPGLHFPPGVTVFFYHTERENHGDWQETGSDIGRQLLSLPIGKSPVAVYINDDKTTWSAMQYLLDHHIRVPEDFAFISWDGLEESNYVRIPLTTMMIPHAEMIYHALAWCMDADSLRHPVVLRPNINFGASLPLHGEQSRKQS